MILVQMSPMPDQFLDILLLTQVNKVTDKGANAIRLNNKANNTITNTGSIGDLNKLLGSRLWQFV